MELELKRPYQEVYDDCTRYRDALIAIKYLLVLPDGKTDSYDGTANPVIVQIVDEAING